MTLFPKARFDAIKTVSIADRPRRVSEEQFASGFTPVVGGEFEAFLNSLPNVLKTADLRDFISEVTDRHVLGKSVMLLFGGHVIKTGLAPIVIDLMSQSIVTSISMNSAAAIHDVENALFGRTSEDVGANVQDGTFGMSRETGEFINGTLERAMQLDEVGYGEALGLELLERQPEHLRNSVLAAAVRLRVPVTVHAAIGTDIVHQQPTMRGDVTGEMSFRDFRLLARLCGDLDGGAVMNVGSAVIMPEVFLKAVTIARNLGLGGRGFVAANFDMLQHYRPQMNILERPTKPDSKYYSFTGHHEIMIPLVAAALKLAIIQRRKDG